MCCPEEKLGVTSPAAAGNLTSRVFFVALNANIPDDATASILGFLSGDEVYYSL
jgi:hypothetical protein